MTDLRNSKLLVAGAGLMGIGIAQVAALAGHPVLLFDARDGAAAEARAKLDATLQGLVAKGRLESDAARTAIDRIEPIGTLEQARGVRLVVEAIVEQLAAKRDLFRRLEGIVGADAVLATNTSSISVTAIANGLAQPGRLVGMHFFNPVPLMKLVEVVSGLHTDPALAQAIFDLARAWGKTPVHAKSTPGFIVNRIARPYYAEALALLHERACTPAVLDACLRGAGFRMGPCELMDLVGHDTNFAVTSSVYEANFSDARYRPSLLQREMVDGGLFGRKNGRGFYRYPEGAPALPAASHAAPEPVRAAVVHGSGPIAEQLAELLADALAATGLAPKPARERASAWVGVELGDAHLVLSDGRCAQQIAAALGRGDVAVFDRPLAQPRVAGTVLAYALAPSASPRWRAQAPAWLAALGFAPQEMADTPGLLAARTVAMLINEAADAVLQGVCEPVGADAAMKLGVNYPQGPFEWLAAWGAADVVQLLERLDAHYRGERYRVSPWLRRAAARQAFPTAPIDETAP